MIDLQIQNVTIQNDIDEVEAKTDSCRSDLEQVAIKGQSLDKLAKSIREKIAKNAAALVSVSVGCGVCVSCVCFLLFWG